MFFSSGPMAWLIAGILILMSLASWAIIFSKSLLMRRAESQTDQFLEVFRPQPEVQ